MTDDSKGPLDLDAISGLAAEVESGQALRYGKELAAEVPALVARVREMEAYTATPCGMEHRTRVELVARAERAEAACAQMRAMFGHIVNVINPKPSIGGAIAAQTIAVGAYHATDVGAGFVSPEQHAEVVEKLKEWTGWGDDVCGLVEPLDGEAVWGTKEVRTFIERAVKGTSEQYDARLAEVVRERDEAREVCNQRDITIAELGAASRKTDALMQRMVSFDYAKKMAESATSKKIGTQKKALVDLEKRNRALVEKLAAQWARAERAEAMPHEERRVLWASIAQADGVAAEARAQLAEVTAQAAVMREALVAVQDIDRSVDPQTGGYAWGMVTRIKVMEALASDAGKALAERLSVLERIAKYAVEDRAKTPGCTRLARTLDELAALDAHDKAGGRVGGPGVIDMEKP